MDIERVRSFLDRNSTFWLLMILFVSIYLKFFYVFYMTSYENYLYDQMDTWWQMSTESFYRGDLETNQWILWPPIAHILLSWVFKILYLFDMYQYKLDFVLGINIILSTMSGWLIYLISIQLLFSRDYALVVTFLFSFFFPLVYLDAFVTIAHPSMFVFLLAIVVLIYNYEDPLRLFIAGVLLALAISLKPAWILSVVPFIGYIFFYNDDYKRNILNSIIFISGFIIFVFFTIVANNAISTGKLKTLSTNEGLSYYIQSCHKYGIESNSTDEKQLYVPATIEDRSELPVSQTDVPFYRQTYFYKKGYECAINHKSSFIEYAKHIKSLYRGFSYPSAKYARYSSKLLPLFGKLILAMSMLLLLVPLLYIDNKIVTPISSLLISLSISKLLIMNLLVVGQLDIYAFLPEIIMLGTLVLYSMYHTLMRYWWIWGVYGGGVILAFSYL